MTGLYSSPYGVDEYDHLADTPPEERGGGLTDYGRRTGGPLRVDRETAAGLQRGGEARMSGTPAAVWLGVPLRTADRVIGVMAIQNYEDPSAYSE